MAKRAARGSGTVYYREKQGKWCGEVTIKGHKYTVYDERQHECRKKLNQLIAEVQSGSYIEPSLKTVKEHLLDWLDLRAPHLTGNTYEYYRGHFARHIIPEIGHIKLKDLSASDIQKMINKKSQNGRKDGKKGGLSPDSIKKAIYTPLKSALAEAVEADLIKKNPVKGVKLPPNRQKKKINILEDEDLIKFLAAARQNKYGYILIFILATGLRIGETLGLTWDRVDFSENMIHVGQQLQRVKGQGLQIMPYTKGDYAESSADRYIRLQDEDMDRLREIKERQETLKKQGDMDKNWDLVFCQQNGKPFCPNNFRNRHYKKVLEQAGINEARIHDLRHLYATMALEAGMDFKSVSESLGHSSPDQLIRTYSHVREESRKKLSSIVSHEVSGVINKVQEQLGTQEEKRQWPPTDEELKDLVWQMPQEQIGKLYGVTGRAVGKRCEERKIKRPGRGHWQRTRRDT